MGLDSPPRVSTYIADWVTATSTELTPEES